MSEKHFHLHSLAMQSSKVYQNDIWDMGQQNRLRQSNGSEKRMKSHTGYRKEVVNKPKHSKLENK